MTMRYAAAFAVPAALTLVLAGCSGSSDESPEPPPATKSAAGDKDAGPLQVRGGTASPGSLSDFACGPADDGSWSATGKVSNADTSTGDYRVTVLVAPPDAATGKAREITLAGIGAGESEKFEAKKLPTVAGDDPMCSVQVTRLT